MANALVGFEWIVPESQVGDRVAGVESAGGTVSNSGSAYVPTPDEAKDYTAAGFEPLTLIAGVAAASYLLGAIDKIWRNRRASGGVIVDARWGQVRVRPVPTMRAGQLVVIQESGTQVFEEAEAKQAAALLTSVLETIGRPGTQ